MGIAQCVASLVSEGGMKTYKSRMHVLEKIIENQWQIGNEVEIFLKNSPKSPDRQKEDEDTTDNKAQVKTEDKEMQR